MVLKVATISPAVLPGTARSIVQKDLAADRDCVISDRTPVFLDLIGMPNPHREG